MRPRRAASVLACVVLATPALAQPVVADPPPVGVTQPAESPERVPSWGDVVRSAGGDFLRLPSRESAAILGVAGGLSLSVHQFDERVTRHASTSRVLDRVFVAGEIGGGGLVQIGGAVATYLVGRGTGRTRVAVVGADLVRAQIVTSALTQGLKVSVRRRRPDGTRFSFPSGHTSLTFATATVLQRSGGWRLGIPAYAFAAYVGASRLQANRHYLSDVLFGAGLGIVSGRTVTVGRGRGTWVVRPAAAPGAMGVTFTRLGARAAATVRSPQRSSGPPWARSP